MDRPPDNISQLLNLRGREGVNIGGPPDGHGVGGGANANANARDHGMGGVMQQPGGGVGGGQEDGGGNDGGMLDWVKQNKDALLLLLITIGVWTQLIFWITVW